MMLTGNAFSGHGLKVIAPVVRVPHCRPRQRITRSYASQAEEVETEAEAASSSARNWKTTLFLPQTKFPIRADAFAREPLFRERTTTALYRWQAEQKDRPAFVLHDGPPYANGELHLGHALNKIIKDTLNRYHLLNGKRIHYHPGWDCHGLPIENKIYGRQEMQGSNATTADPLLVRELARAVATTEIAGQKKSFQTYSVMADWSEESTYRTFDLEYSIRQMRILRQMADQGLIYRARRPVYWSPKSRSALAESEIEYTDNQFSRSLYVRFPLTIGKRLADIIDRSSPDIQKAVKSSTLGKGRIDAIIWTTTPWTLPSNMAMNVNADLNYTIVRPSEGLCKGQVFIMATDLLPRKENLKLAMKSKVTGEQPLLGPLERLVELQGRDLLDSTYRHAFLPEGARDRPIIAAAYVTAEAGTGLVHSAPGHGHEDYLSWLEHCETNPEAKKEEILSPVDDLSRYTGDVRQLRKAPADDEIDLRGALVLSEGTRRIIAQLKTTKDLMTEVRMQHRLPIDWRTKTAVIVRSTSQWFADLTSLRGRALEALQDVVFRPPTGRSKLESLLTKRGEWCISRQRNWGVPIPVVYNAETDEALFTVENMEHIEQVLASKGLDYWWKGNAIEFVKPSLRRENVVWRKGQDIVDVWFDSGCSWNTLPGSDAVLDSATSGDKENTTLADVYFEGTDQHRGWFQSSLLTYIALNGSSGKPSAPFKEVYTHGFTLDKKRQKLSKSLGNYKSPDHFIAGGAKKTEPAYGTDAVRFWTARGDPTKDIIVSDLVIKHSSDALRKVRNTFRYMLSLLPSQGQGPKLEEQELGIVERYILHELYMLEQRCRQAYDTYDPTTIASGLLQFCSHHLSALYFAITKDALYADEIASRRRQSILAVLDQCLRTLLSIAAPVVPHLVEEVFHYYRGATCDPQSGEGGEDAVPPSFFIQGWQSVPERFFDEDVEKEFSAILNFRPSVYAELEKGRQAKWLAESRSVSLDILRQSTADDVSSTLTKHIDILAEVMSFAQVHIVEKLSDVEMEGDEKAWHLDGEHQGVKFRLRPSPLEKCPRCWIHRKENQDDICGRCQSATAGRL